MNKQNFHITINGLVYDKNNRLLLIKDIHDSWDLPGGRLHHDETFSDCFERECIEELGVLGKIISDTPRYIWTAKDYKNDYRLMMCFDAELKNNNFKKSNECIDHNFFELSEIYKIKLRPQTKKIIKYIK